MTSLAVTATKQKEERRQTMNCYC